MTHNAVAMETHPGTPRHPSEEGSPCYPRTQQAMRLIRQYSPDHVLEEVTWSFPVIGCIRLPGEEGYHA